MEVIYIDDMICCACSSSCFNEFSAVALFNFYFISRMMLNFKISNVVRFCDNLAYPSIVVDIGEVL